MTDPTTPPTVTPEQKLAAQGEYDRLQEQLLARFPPSDVSPEKLAHVNKMLEARKIIDTPELAPPPAGLTWRERREHREDQRALRSELTEQTVEGSPEAKAVIADILDEQKSFDTKTARPVPGRVDWAVVEGTPSLQSLAPDDRWVFIAWAQTAGVEPAEAPALAALVQDIARLDPPVAARPKANWQERWGAAFDTKEAHLERALQKITDDQYDWLQRHGLGREGSAALVERLVELGARLGTR